MYSSVGYRRTSYALITIEAVKRSAAICFCVLVLAGISFQQARASASFLVRATNVVQWNNTMVLTTLGGHLYSIEKSGALLSVNEDSRRQTANSRQQKLERTQCHYPAASKADGG